MSSVDRGTGSPIVLLPGIQGRWEWMAPTIAALSRRHRVLSFSLNDVGERPLFERCVSHIDALLDRAGEREATILGVSFGGLIGVRYAARRPARARSLVLAAVPSPRATLEPRVMTAVSHPWLAFPLFAAGSLGRLTPEIVASHDSWLARLRFASRYAARAVQSPMSPSASASWVREWLATDLAADCCAIVAPTLVVTGEPGLDRVVPVTSTLQYVDLVPGAERRTLPRTGHLGFVTRPLEFAAIVDAFLEDSAPAPRQPRTASAVDRSPLSASVSGATRW
jgi:pimeloyl-ACP methyl ester carboxylesterase